MPPAIPEPWANPPTMPFNRTYGLRRRFECRSIAIRFSRRGTLRQVDSRHGSTGTSGGCGDTCANTEEVNKPPGKMEASRQRPAIRAAFRENIPVVCAHALEFAVLKSTARQLEFRLRFETGHGHSRGSLRSLDLFLANNAHRRPGYGFEPL